MSAARAAHGAQIHVDSPARRQPTMMRAVSTPNPRTVGGGEGEGPGIPLPVGWEKSEAWREYIRHGPPGSPQSPAVLHRCLCVFVCVCVCVCV